MEPHKRTELVNRLMARPSVLEGAPRNTIIDVGKRGQ